MKNNELHHFGKKGMKWGVRNTVNKLTQPYRTHKEINKKTKEILSPIQKDRKRIKTLSTLMGIAGGIFADPVYGAGIHTIGNAPNTIIKFKARKIAKKLVKTKSKEKYEAYVNKNNSFAIKKVRPKKKKK